MATSREAAAIQVSGNARKVRVFRRNDLLCCASTPEGSVTPKIQQLANRIVDCESQQLPKTTARSESVVRVCEKLRLQLTPLIGTAGYHALITRTLALLSKEHPWNEFARVQPDGTLRLVAPSGTPESDNLLLENAAAIPAQLLSLLAVFIGEPLATNLALEMWPIPPAGTHVKASHSKSKSP